MKAQGYTKETIRDIGKREIDFPAFNVGDTIAVHQRIKEGDKERIQIFEGDVLAIKNNGVASTFTIRKMGAHGIAVERIIPYHSPLVKTIEVIKRGDVRRAKLYYVRDRVGRSARIQEKIVTHEQKELRAAREAGAEKAVQSAE